MVYSSTEISPVPSLMSASALDSPTGKIVGPHSMMCTPLGHLGNTSSCLSGSITGAQQLTMCKYNLQAPRLLTQCAADNSTWHGAVTE